MPASIAHMLISKKAREELRKDTVIRKFVEDVLEKHEIYMELGSIGPDLPYYESMAKGAVDLLLKRSDKPMGIDQWSYQLHSKDPNIFPLKMIEIIWKETDIEKEDWEDDDHKKFAFVCGYLTHIASDQIIHRIVNLIAGPYYKKGDAREKHRECEVYQDLYLFNLLKEDLGKKDFQDEKFNTWCDMNPGFGDNTDVWFRYLIQKSFVEAHAVTPSEDSVEDWVDGTLTILRGLNNIGPYVKASGDLAKKGEKYREYIELQPPKDAPDDKKKEYAALVSGKTYKDFFNNAVELSSIYVKAAHKIYSAEELDDDLREDFKAVVRNADLSSPLEKGILEKARSAFED